MSTLLTRTPNLRLVLTSREALGLAGERRRVVAGLPLLEAVELFLDRSGLAADRDDDAVSRLCDRLDGIPLAIEIAAARAAELGPAAVERGVADTQLEEAGRSVLEATLTWSHELLAADEQIMFRRLGVFAGQFTLAGAEAVVVDEELDAMAVLDLLDALVQRSLLVPTDEGGFRQLFVVRQYAARLAQQAGEYDALTAAHLLWCLALANALRTSGLDERARFDPLRQVGDELLAALDRPFDGEFAALQVQLAGALEEFWYLRGAFSEGRAHLEAVLERGGGFRSHRAEVHRSAGFLARCQGDLDAAMQHLGASLGLLREILAELQADDSPHVPLFEQHLVKTLTIMSEVALLRGETESALALAREATLCPTPMAADATLLLGLAEHAAGDRLGAIRHIEQARRAAQTAGDDGLLANCLRNLGVIARDEGELAQAETHYRQALALDRRSGREQILAHTLLSLAELAALTGSGATAELDEGLELARAVGDRQAEAHGLSTLADLVAPTNHDEARRLHRHALRLREHTGARGEAALSKLRLAALAEAEAEGDTFDAVDLATDAEAIFLAGRDHRGATEALALLTVLHARAGEVGLARDALRGACKHAKRAPTVVEHGDVLDAAAWLAVARGSLEDARTLWAAAEEHRRDLGIAELGGAAILRAQLRSRVRDVGAADTSPQELLDALTGPV